MKRQRVFQIDQECFIIFAETYYTPNERFLRIGNSSFLKEFGESLTFTTLLTPLYPGNPFAELEIFQPGVDRKLIGLKRDVEQFLHFLNKGGVDLSRVKVLYAEGQGAVGGSKATEEEFLKALSQDEGRRKRHSFASFYNNGNIRIFNRNELFFDLLQQLASFQDERAEIRELSSHFEGYYHGSYRGNGFIVSGKSLFAFSEERFICLTASANWVTDAIRVGITPEQVELLYLAEGVEPDSLWIKVFLEKWKRGEQIKLVSGESSPLWINLLPPGTYELLCPKKRTVDINFGPFRLFFQNKRINLFFKNYKLHLNGLDSIMDEGREIGFEALIDKKRVKNRFVIESLERQAITIYRCNPVIFHDHLLENDSITTFFRSLDVELDGRSRENILPIDSDYGDNYIPDVGEGIGPLLLVENIRRVSIENNSHTKEKSLDYYRNKLSRFSGEEINRNHLIINQLIGVGPDRKIRARNVVNTAFFSMIADSLNPFLFFQKELDKKEVKSRYSFFRESGPPDRGELKGLYEAAEVRYEGVIEAKEFYQEERARLRELLSEIVEKEERGEVVSLESEEESAVSAGETAALYGIGEEQKAESSVAEVREEAGGDTYNAAELLEQLGDSKAIRQAKKNRERALKEERLKSGEKRVPVKRRFPAALSRLLFILLLAALIGGGAYGVWRAYRHFRPQLTTKSVLTQEEFLKNNREKFDEQKVKPKQKSYYYKFYMTLRDIVHLTNKIAIANGYHRMLFSLERNYVKGRDPDWIYPGNVLRMPDGKWVVVQSGDTMWRLCESFLIEQVNGHEVEIRELIEKTKRKEIKIGEAKEQFTRISEETDSEMIRGFLAVLLLQDDFDAWEPYLKKKR